LNPGSDTSGQLLITHYQFAKDPRIVADLEIRARDLIEKASAARPGLDSSSVGRHVVVAVQKLARNKTARQTQL
jgi:hypothetical protein